MPDVIGYTLAFLFTVETCLVIYLVETWLLEKYGNPLHSYINRHSESWLARCVFRLTPHKKRDYNDNDTNNEKDNDPRMVANPSQKLKQPFQDGTDENKSQNDGDNSKDVL